MDMYVQYIQCIYNYIYIYCFNIYIHPLVHPGKVPVGWSMLIPWLVCSGHFLQLQLLLNCGLKPGPPAWRESSAIVHQEFMGYLCDGYGHWVEMVTILYAISEICEYFRWVHQLESGGWLRQTSKKNPSQFEWIMVNHPKFRTGK